MHQLQCTAVCINNIPPTYMYNMYCILYVYNTLSAISRRCTHVSSSSPVPLHTKSNIVESVPPPPPPPRSQRPRPMYIGVWWWIIRAINNARAPHSQRGGHREGCDCARLPYHGTSGRAFRAIRARRVPVARRRAAAPFSTLPCPVPVSPRSALF